MQSMILSERQTILTLRWRSYANVLALLGAGESVSIALTTSIPEPRTTAVFNVVVPVDGIVAARASIRRQAASDYNKI